MQETECFGVLTKKLFQEFQKDFTEKLGTPTCKSRLAISFWNPKRGEIETRIRITNKDAELMQKTGVWNNTKVVKVEEVQIKLPSDLETIFNLYKILDNEIQKEYPNSILQYQSYIYKTSDYEIKLSIQLGKTQKYNFEVELLNNECNLLDIIRKLGLYEHITQTNTDFWLKWNKELNLTTDTLTNKEIKDIIKDYL